MKLLIFLIFSFIWQLLSTSCSAPRTTKEFIKDYGDSVWIDRQDFKLNATLPIAKKRLIEMMNTCFHIKIEQVAVGNISSAVMGVIVYRPEIEEDANHFQISLRRSCQKGCGLNETDEGGILMVSRIQKTSAKEVQVKIYTPKYGYGDMSKNIADWIKDEKKLCPPLQW